MSRMIQADTIGELWYSQLKNLVYNGLTVAPRDQKCCEMTDIKLVLNHANHNILLDPTRKLNYRFMVAEWLYIWFGHEDVKTIGQYNPNMAAFSDNGVDFNGSYGPPILHQWPRILQLLGEDITTRQAVIQIYRPPMGPTKDVPCTLTIQFLVREHQLNTLVSMRSSDIWLGLPYDIFNFTMLANILAAQLHVQLGWFSINLGSSHLYESNRKKALKVLVSCETGTLGSPIFRVPPPNWLDATLINKKMTVYASLQCEHAWSDLLFPWTRYENVLLSQTQEYAIDVLRSLSGHDTLNP